MVKVLVKSLEVLAWVLVVVTPILGVWVASSLAAFLNGPIWLALLTGLLLFPIIPLAWDRWGARRFERRMARRAEVGKSTRDPVLTFSERMLGRTFLINLAFLAALLATFPQSGFAALATRGDWFTTYLNDNHAEAIRPGLFRAAEGLAWLYELTVDNPYADDTIRPLPRPTRDEFGDVTRRVVTKTDVTKTDVTKTDTTTVKTSEDDDAKANEVVEQPRAEGEAPAWPMAATLHPLVENFPKEYETDYVSAARYIRDNEPDPFLRVKALNDFIARRLVYDFPMLHRMDATGEWQSQEAADVFERKAAVCAGYAKLLVAMGEVTGDEIVYITGVSRDQEGNIRGGGHAWNAAKIEGRWYLIDPTWNDGEREFEEARYNTNYLFAPPEVFSQDHLPDDPDWQLRIDPITRGEFVRQPMMSPQFFAAGLKLVSPQRSQIEATGGRVQVQLENTKSLVVRAHTLDDAQKRTDCTVTGTTSVTIDCRVARGTHQLQLYAGPKSNSYPWVGRFEVTAR